MQRDASSLLCSSADDMVEPMSKKRKLDPNGHNPLVKQESFSAAVEQLEAEDDAAEGMPRLNVSRLRQIR